MADTDHMQMFDDGDDMLFGDADLFGSAVPCIAGELELQVQSYEGAGDLAVGDSSAVKSFCPAKDSGGSSLSALAAADFGDADFMDNVSLDDLAAADHYGHTVCGRQSTADSSAAAGAARTPAARDSWTAVGSQPPCATAADPQQRGPGAQDQDPHCQAQESSDCDMSHTLGDGESSGVGPGKSVALGSSHSEASEDNTAGVAAAGANRDEEHISMPSFGLSLSRLTGGGANPAEELQSGRSGPRERRHSQRQQQTLSGGEQQKAQQAPMPRAFSVGNFALAGATSAASPKASASHLDGQRRAQVMRSFSYIDPDTLPSDFSLGCGDTDPHFSFGTRGRCASLNETQLRRQWLQEGELLAPQLPPSVSELELLELPEDSFPVRPPGRGSLLGPPARPLGSGLMQFRGATGAGSSNGAPQQPGQSVTVTVKRKIITSPSPLLQQPKPSKARNSAAPAPVGAAPKGQSPKRARVGPGAAASAWQDGAAAAGGGAPSSAGVLAGWHPARQASLGFTGNMKTVRSVPANMNSFLDGVEVTVQPLGVTGTLDSVISPNSSTISGRGSFFDPSAAAAGTRPAVVVAAMPMPHPAIAPPAKAGKSKVTAQPLAMMGGVGMGGAQGAFLAPGMAVGPDGKRLGPVPSVPKPRKRASPNGNPPKAPAPNPNGHCCTQCGTQTTPVWRAGPHGPKTLCNACGVRYMKVAKGNVAPTPRRQQH